MSASRPTVLCLASYFKGNRFLERCRTEGWNVILLTVESLLGDPWPRDRIDEVFALPTFTDENALLKAVSYLARSRRIERVVALDDFDVEVAAAVREHLRLPGLGASAARFFRDKLAMRTRAEELGIGIPAYTAHAPADHNAAFMPEATPPETPQETTLRVEPGDVHGETTRLRSRRAGLSKIRAGQGTYAA